jgi:hypothetical protein
MKNKIYYSIEDDLNSEDWCYVVIGGRGTGKTYGALKYCFEKEIKFDFVKRTNDEVKVMCGGNTVDLSPFKPINRDLLCDVRPKLMSKGIGGFYKYLNGEINDLPIGYIFSMNAIGDIRGFDASDSDIMIFDEFIPATYSRVSHSEGTQLLDLYKTISRDRELRGKEPLKLIMLANAYRLYNPCTEALGITDDLSEMKSTGESIRHKNGIMIHLLDDNQEFQNREKETAIMKSLSDTSWGRFALSNDFAFDDVSYVKKKSLKGYTPKCSFTNKNRTYYVYERNQNYYVCTSRADVDNYDLSRVGERDRFDFDWIPELKLAIQDDRITFSDYTSFNLIQNYRDIFKH